MAERDVVGLGRPAATPVSWAMLVRGQSANFRPD